MTNPSTDELKALLDGLDDRGAFGCLNQLQVIAPTLAAEVIRLRARIEGMEDYIEEVELQAMEDDY